VKAADNYGLMLFQEGEQDKAMPLIKAAAERGDPRAQYVLGLSHFNADYAPKDWTRAYALMTLANGSGLPQARDALAQMDKYIPQGQRAAAQSLARELEAGAKAQRSADVAAAELGTRAPATMASVVPAVAAPAAKPPVVTAAPKPTGLPPAPRPVSPKPATPVAAPVTVAAAASRPSTVTPVPAALAPRKQGSWRVQLGAFGVAGNADKLWSQIGSHAALAGTRKTLVPSGNLTRLLATGFASEAEAARACASLKREGKACVVAGQG
jgi:cell division septation protein DedD